jgi:hypothetical protein
MPPPQHVLHQLKHTSWPCDQAGAGETNIATSAMALHLIERRRGVGRNRLIIDG